ncbi:monooxygenase family protein [Methylorubrum sp. SB2]|uniref:monooxygenase family protein n=1 Tax=Methylorubrum subtropicum TaxID=3138812 RepID=UPI00313AADDB
MRADAAQETRLDRESVDLSGYPDLVVVYLGFRVGTWRGLLALFGIGRGLMGIQREMPEGLLVHENLVFGLNHVGMRQYWRDLESLETFTRSDPHRTWWRTFGRDRSGGTAFWHEAYRFSGGMEAIYVGLPNPIGLARFAGSRKPDGPFMSSRQRLAG